MPRRDLHTLVTQLGTAFGETGPDLRRLLDSTSELVAEARRQPAGDGDAARDGGTVLDTQNDLSTEINAFARNLATFTDALRAGDRDLRAVVERASPAAAQLVALDHSVDATLPVLLDNLTSLGQVASVRIPALRQILVIYPYVVSTSFGLFPGNGSTRFGVPIPRPRTTSRARRATSTRPSAGCRPSSTTRPSGGTAFCKEPTDADIAVRGARMAPEPDGKRLGDEPGYMSNSGLPGRGSRGGSGGGSGGGGASLGAAGNVAFTGPDGHDYLLGSTGGEQRVLGDRSWMWLIFGPMS